MPRGGYTIAESNQCLNSRCGRNSALCAALGISRYARIQLPKPGCFWDYERADEWWVSPPMNAGRCESGDLKT